MEIRLAPPCQRCGQPYLTGRKGICNTCRSRTRRKTQSNRSSRPLHCDCGKPAISIILAEVGIDDVYTVRLAVCQDCLDLERNFEFLESAPPAGTFNRSDLPAHILKSRDQSWQRVDWP